MAEASATIEHSTQGQTTDAKTGTRTRRGTRPGARAHGQRQDSHRPSARERPPQLQRGTERGSTLAPAPTERPLRVNPATQPPERQVPAPVVPPSAPERPLKEVQPARGQEPPPAEPRPKPEIPSPPPPEPPDDRVDGRGGGNDPHKVLQRFAQLNFSVGALKGTIAGEGRQEQEILEREAQQQTYADETERRNQWAGENVQEGEVTRLRRIRQAINQALPRLWREGINNINTYARNKQHSHDILAEAGVSMRSLPYEFRRLLTERAQETVDANLAQNGTRTARTRERLARWAGQRSRALQAEELRILNTLQGTLTRQDQRSQESQTFLDSTATDQRNRDLLQAFRDVKSGDFAAGEGLAQRLGNDFADDALRAAVGEKRSTDIDLTSEAAQPIVAFFKEQIITPMISEGLANNNNFGQDRLLEFQNRVQEQFRTQAFRTWRESLTPDQQNALDVSLSYGTDIIPMVRELIPNLMAVKDHLQEGTNLQNYVNDIVLRVNIGTLQAGKQGGVEETALQRRFSRNLDAMQMYQQLENGDIGSSAEAYRASLNQASSRLRILGSPRNAGQYNGYLYGLLAGTGLYALQRAGALGGNFIVPFVGGALVSGAVRGAQEGRKFTQEVQFHRRESARGTAYDSDASRRAEMQGLELPTLDIEDGVINPFQENVRLLERMANNQTDDENGQPIDQTQVLQRVFGLLADTNVRRAIMDTDRSVELYHTTSDRSLDAQKTEVERLRARAMTQLRSYVQQNPDQLNQFARSIGITLPRDIAVNNPNYPSDAIELTLAPLRTQLRNNLEQGTEIIQQMRATLETGSDASNGTSIEERRTAEREARRRAIAEKTVYTALGYLGGSFFSHFISQEIIADVHRLGHVVGLTDRPTQTPDIEQAFGRQAIPPTPDGSTPAEAVPPGSHDGGFIGNRHVTIPDGTELRTNADGSQDLIVSGHPDQVLINHATINPDGSLGYEDALGDVHTNPGVEYVPASGLTTAVETPSFRFNVPNGTHVEQQGSIWKLIVDDPSHTELGMYDASTGNFIADPNIDPNKLGIVIDTTPISVDTKVGGPDGVWNQYATPTDRIDWYGNDTRVSDHAELQTSMIKDSDGSLRIRMRSIDISHETGLDPKMIDAQHELIQRNEAQIRLSLPGAENNSIIVDANQYTPDPRHPGVYFADLRLNPDDTTDMVHLQNGQDISQADLSRLLVNQDALNKIPPGDFAPEIHHEFRNVLNIGGPHGEEGEWSVGKYVVKPDGSKVWESIATGFGTGPTPDHIQVPTPHTTISVNNVPQSVLDITVALPTEPGTGPTTPWDAVHIDAPPAVYGRKPLEEGKSTNRSPSEEPRRDKPKPPEDKLKEDIPLPDEPVDPETVSPDPLDLETQPDETETALPKSPGEEQGLERRKPHEQVAIEGEDQMENDIPAIGRGERPPKELESSRHQGETGKVDDVLKGLMLKENQYTDELNAEGKKYKVKEEVRAGVEAYLRDAAARGIPADQAVTRFRAFYNALSLSDAKQKGAISKFKVKTENPLTDDEVANVRTLAREGLRKMYSVPDVQAEAAFNASVDYVRFLSPELARSENAAGAIADLTAMYFDIQDIRNAEKGTKLDGESELTKSLRQTLRDANAGSEQIVNASTNDLNDFVNANPEALFGPEVQVQNFAITKDQASGTFSVTGTFTLPGQQSISIASAQFSVDNEGKLALVGSAKYNLDPAETNNVGPINTLLRNLPDQLQSAMTNLGREGWQVTGFTDSRDGNLGIKYEKSESIRKHQKLPPSEEPTVEQSPDDTLELDVVTDHQEEEKREYLAKKVTDLKKSIEDMRRDGDVDLALSFTTAGGRFTWQQVGMGKYPDKDGGDLFRGYCMIEPEDIPQAVEILLKLGKDRLQSGKSTNFKWLLKRDRTGLAMDGMDEELGDYQTLEKTDPRIAIYADDPREIRDILSALSRDPHWQDMEQRRVAVAADRRPGTNAFVDGGREYRSLNYNEVPGYSEDQADDPSWRERKVGTPTITYEPSNE